MFWMSSSSEAVVNCSLFISRFSFNFDQARPVISGTFFFWYSEVMFPWTPSSFEAFGKLVSVTQFKVSNFGKEFPPIFYPTTSPLCSIAVKSSTLQMCISRGKFKSFSIQFLTFRFILLSTLVVVATIKQDVGTSR